MAGMSERSNREVHPAPGTLPERVRRSARGRRVVVGVIVAAGLVGGCRRGDVGAFDPVHDRVAEQSISRGWDRLGEGDLDGATRNFERAIRHDPSNPEGYAGLGRIAERQGRWPQAIDYYQDAFRRSREPGGYALLLGKALRTLAATSIHRARLAAAALRIHEHASLSANASMEALLGLGDCHQLLGDNSAALAVFEQARQLDPYSVEPLLAMARTWAAMGRHADAMDACGTALRLAPEDAAVHHTMADVNLSRASGDGPGSAMARQRALAHYRKSLRINPAQLDVRRRIADLEAPTPRAVTAADDSLDY